MAVIEISEMRQLTLDKLRVAVKKAKRDLAVSRFHVQTGQNQDVAGIKKKRQAVAQLLTVLNEKQA